LKVRIDPKYFIVHKKRVAGGATERAHELPSPKTRAQNFQKKKKGIQGGFDEP
jgi:hypothetical protein